ARRTDLRAGDTPAEVAGNRLRARRHASAIARGGITHWVVAARTVATDIRPRPAVRGAVVRIAVVGIAIAPAPVEAEAPAAPVAHAKSPGPRRRVIGAIPRIAVAGAVEDRP